LGDRSDPLSRFKSHAEMVEKDLKLPPTAIGGIALCLGDCRRKDLKLPPTAVGRIAELCTLGVRIIFAIECRS